MDFDIQKLHEQFVDDLAEVRDISQLAAIKVKYLGKKGLVSDLLGKIGSLPIEEKKTFGAKINQMKTEVVVKLALVNEQLEDEQLKTQLQNDWVDVTLPPRLESAGSIHPISKTILDIRKILESFGFAMADGPEVEDSWHNFSALNISELHPARQMHDTFYVNDNQAAEKSADQKMLLRTHTSNVQIRYMSSHKPPYSVYSIGKVYRSDMDATHTPMFHQVEGLLIEKDITLRNLKWCLEEFLKFFFEVEHAPIRFRPSYFPFTEPSYEVDVLCDRSKKGEIKIGTGSDWLEILGCGMVNEKVLQNVSVDPGQYQGFAFGIGIERLAMLKYNISDLRSFFHGDLRWLANYRFSAI